MGCDTVRHWRRKGKTGVGQSREKMRPGRILVSSRHLGGRMRILAACSIGEARRGDMIAEKSEMIVK